MKKFSLLLFVIAASATQAQLTTRDSSKPLAMPKFGDRTARAQLQKVMAVFEKPKSILLQLEGAGPRRSIWVKGRQARFQTSDILWAHDGKTLSASFARERVYIFGACSRTDLYETLGNQEHSVDPFLRNLWRGLNPIRQFLGPEMTVRSSGSMKSAQVGECFILTATSKTRRLSIVASKATGVPVSITADALDTSGKSISSSTVNFLRIQRNVPLTDKNFRVPNTANYRKIGISQAPD